MMMYKETTKVIPLGDDREITISTGKLAKQADGAVVVKQGGYDAPGDRGRSQRRQAGRGFHAAFGGI